MSPIYNDPQKTDSQLSPNSKRTSRAKLGIAAILLAIVGLTSICGAYIYMQERKISELNDKIRTLEQSNAANTAKDTQDSTTPATIAPDTVSDTAEYKSGDLTFSYPKALGTLTLATNQEESKMPIDKAAFGMYTFKSTDADIEGVAYHKDSGALAWVEHGVKYQKPDECYFNNGETEVTNFQQVVKVLRKDSKEAKTIFSTDKTADGCVAGSLITALRFSPDAAYIGVSEGFWEGSAEHLFNIEIGENIIPEEGYVNQYEGVAWQKETNTLAVITESIEAYGAAGIDGVFLSEKGNPDKLTKIFTMDSSRAAEDFISDVAFKDSSTLTFGVFSFNNDGSKKAKESYSYAISTKKLTKTN